MRCKRLLWLLLCAGFSNAPASEQTSLQLQALVPTKQQYVATEIINGTVFNQDKGTISARGVGLSYGGAWRYGVNVDQTKGQVQYTGQTQGGFPAFSRSDLNIQSTDIWTGFKFALPGAVTIEPALHLKSRSWERNIQSVGFLSGLKETVYTQSLGISTALDWTFQGLGMPVTLSGSIGIDRPYYQRMNVVPAKTTDPFRLSPQAKFSQTFNLGARLHLASDIEVIAFYQRNDWRAGPSASVPTFGAGQPLGQAYFPGVRQTTSGWRFGITLSH
jgi:hypothetical protein